MLALLPKPWPSSPCATSPGTDSRPNATSPTGPRSPSPTCAPACTRSATRLDSFSHHGRTFFHAPADSPTGPQQRAGHLMQILDETYRGYQDSRWVLDAAGAVPGTRESAIGMALIDAQLVAAMRRTIAADHVRFDLWPYRPLIPAQLDALDQAAERYGRFLRLSARLTVP